MQAVGEAEVVTLARSAWVGTHRWGAAVWSGDIPSTFDSLAISVRAGVSIALSGISHWTTDIGEYRSANQIRTACG